MKTFDEWMEENHPEYFEENFWKKLAIGGALAGSALGATGIGGAYMIGKKMGQQPTQTQQQGQPTHPLGSYYAKERERQRKDMKDKEDQLKAKGLKSGKFVHGKLVEPDESRNPQISIPSKSYTSPDARKFLDRDEE